MSICNCFFVGSVCVLMLFCALLLSSCNVSLFSLCNTVIINVKHPCSPYPFIHTTPLYHPTPMSFLYSPFSISSCGWTCTNFFFFGSLALSFLPKQIISISPLLFCVLVSGVRLSLLLFFLLLFAVTHSVVWVETIMLKCNLELKLKYIGFEDCSKL